MNFCSFFLLILFFKIFYMIIIFFKLRQFTYAKLCIKNINILFLLYIYNILFLENLKGNIELLTVKKKITFSKQYMIKQYFSKETHYFC